MKRLIPYIACTLIGAGIGAGATATAGDSSPTASPSPQMTYIAQQLTLLKLDTNTIKQRLGGTPYTPNTVWGDIGAICRASNC